MADLIQISHLLASPTHLDVSLSCTAPKKICWIRMYESSFQHSILCLRVCMFMALNVVGFMARQICCEWWKPVACSTLSYKIALEIFLLISGGSMQAPTSMQSA